MVGSIIVGILLLLYVIWVVRRKVRQFREGNYCGGSCCDCGCGCDSKEKKDK